MNLSCMIACTSAAYDLISDRECVPASPGVHFINIVKVQARVESSLCLDLPDSSRKDLITMMQTIAQLSCPDCQVYAAAHLLYHLLKEHDMVDPPGG